MLKATHVGGLWGTGKGFGRIGYISFGLGSNSSVISKPTRSDLWVYQNTTLVYVTNANTKIPTFQANYYSFLNNNWSGVMDSAGNFWGSDNTSIYKVSTSGVLSVSTSPSSVGTSVFVSVDSSDLPYMLSASASATVNTLTKLTGAGAITWSRSLTTTGTMLSPMGVSVDGAGNVYTLAQANISATNHLYLLKHNSSGVSQWVSKLLANGFGAVSAVGGENPQIVFDSSNNPYIIVSAGTNSKHLIKVDPTTGGVTWNMSFSATNSASLLAINCTNDLIYVCGYAAASSVNYGFRAVINTSGTMISVTGANKATGFGAGIQSFTKMANGYEAFVMYEPISTYVAVISQGDPRGAKIPPQTWTFPESQPQLTYSLVSVISGTTGTGEVTDSGASGITVGAGTQTSTPNALTTSFVRGF